MTTARKAQANRRNARRSTGPATGEGVRACKHNALRHGLRALQTVVPGEDPHEWEAHRAAVVADRRPAGAVELALAEDVAAKFWRLGRVLRFEADLIANGRDADVLLHAHEAAHRRCERKLPARTDIPTRRDVEKAKRALDEAEEKVAEIEAALGALVGLAGMGDAERVGDWSLCESLETALGVPFDGDEDDSWDEDEPFRARHLRAMLGEVGAVDEVTADSVGSWRDERIAGLRSKAGAARTTYRGLLRRDRAALGRRRRAHGLPGPADLDRVQRYETHLERGLHKALDRLLDLQERRGAVPPAGSGGGGGRRPGGPGGPAAALVGPCGKNALDAPPAARADGAGGGDPADEPRPAGSARSRSTLADAAREFEEDRAREGGGDADDDPDAGRLHNDR